MSGQTNHDAHDGCLCGWDHSKYRSTPDHELPPTIGGVEGDYKLKKRRKATRTVSPGKD